MTTKKQREFAFRAELAELLEKHGAELEVTDDGKPWGDSIAFARAIESAVSASKAAEYAYIRREARNAALEEAAKVFRDCPLWGISPEAAEEMVLALKDQP